MRAVLAADAVVFGSSVGGSSYLTPRLYGVAPVDPLLAPARKQLDDTVVVARWAAELGGPVAVPFPPVAR